jgi:hypothetical protein
LPTTQSSSGPNAPSADPNAARSRYRGRAGRRPHPRLGSTAARRAAAAAQAGGRIAEVLAGRGCRAIEPGPTLGVLR